MLHHPLFHNHRLTRSRFYISKQVYQLFHLGSKNIYRVHQRILTHYESEQTNSLREKYKIKGVPTIVFLTADGAELNNIRLVGFEEADQFLRKMRTALSGRNLDEKR